MNCLAYSGSCLMEEVFRGYQNPLPGTCERSRRGLLQGRDQCMFQEKASGIGKIQIIRDTLKVAVKFVLLYRNALDQNCLASHIYGDLSYFPLIGCDLGSLQ